MYNGSRSIRGGTLDFLCEVDPEVPTILAGGRIGVELIDGLLVKAAGSMSGIVESVLRVLNIECKYADDDSTCTEELLYAPFRFGKAI